MPRMILSKTKADWLSRCCDSFSIRHNAHHEMETTVARHLLHRERLGDALVFSGREGRALCEVGTVIWELSVRQADGRQVHYVASDLGECLAAAERDMNGGMRQAAIAA